MQEITLTQNTFTLFPTVYAVQNDTGRELKMIIQDQTLLLGDTGAVAVQRSDGSYYTIPATIQLGDNAFKADISQALTQPGRTLCQLKVTRSDLVVSSYTFAIMVQPSTDGVPAEQLGVTVDELMEAAAQLTLSDNDVKLALLQIAAKVVYTDPNGQEYYDALEEALYPPIRATSVTLDKNSLVFSGVGGTDTLVATVSPDNVEDGTVFWGSSDKAVAVVSDGIVTAVAVGSCTITATCGTKHASASVSVVSATLVSISASYTQTGTVYNIDDLSAILTAGSLVVTATWSNSTTSIVPNEDVTLSGSLTPGTSTITVEYGGKSDTISVTVTDIIPAEYTRVQYLHSSANAAGTQSYINTGITFSSPTLAKFRIIFSEDSDANGACYAIGVRQTGTGNTNNIGWGVRVMNHTQIDSWSNTPGASISGAEAFSVFDVTATWESNRLTVKEGTGTEVVATQTTRSITAGYPICLFGLKYATAASGGSPYPIKGKIFYAKAEQDGTTLLECYPVVRNSDSKPGFYDIKNNAFYAPYGNYITAGPEE